MAKSNSQDGVFRFLSNTGINLGGNNYLLEIGDKIRGQRAFYLQKWWGIHLSL
jgi:hypothetical protein